MCTISQNQRDFKTVAGPLDSALPVSKTAQLKGSASNGTYLTSKRLILAIGDVPRLFSPRENSCRPVATLWHQNNWRRIQP